MEINLVGLTYTFMDGETSSAVINFDGYGNGNTLNSTIVITKDDLATGVSFDDLSKKSIEKLARKKLAGFFITE